MQPTSGTHEAVTGPPSPVDTVPAATRSGVVTFLLTDIEGSTNAWDRDEHSMSALMAEHDRILAGAVARHDGIRPVEQGEGDSMVAVFLRAADALAAATDAQRELQAELGERCRVRMAVHSGETLMRLDLDGATMRYAGPTIIRCARLRSSDHGGQLLVSSATAALVRGELPDSAGLDQLGTVILRGMAEPEPVFQLTHPDLQHEFPPLRGLDATPTTLPSTLTTFFGRQGELDSIAALLQTGRLVTITGATHLSFTDLCGATGLSDDSPLGPIADAAADAELGVEAPDSLAVIYGVGCEPGTASGPAGWAPIRQVVMAHLRNIWGIDAFPVGLGDELSGFPGIPVTYVEE